MTSERLLAVLASIALAACVADQGPDAPDDAEAEVAAPQMLGKADAPAFDGLYVTHATTHKDGDITSLQLIGGSGMYVRERCYHASCALPLHRSALSPDRARSGRCRWCGGTCSSCCYG
jgi:hypothetical protein